MIYHSERGNVVAKPTNLVLILFSVCAMALCLTACGDDDSSFAPRQDDDSSTETSSSSVMSGDIHDNSAGSSAGSSPPSCSSTDKKSSSSSVASSNSAGNATPCKTETEDNCEYGELVDDRDGQIYKTVKIGNQWWMAENLNYAYSSTEEPDYPASTCYEHSGKYCEKYGRLYTWATAVDKWESECDYQTCSLPSGNIQGMCPSGWHLPSKAEWEKLFWAVGGKMTAGEMLMSSSECLYSKNGTDSFGFSALPAGKEYNITDFQGEGRATFFWTSTESHDDYAYHISLGCDLDDVYEAYISKGYWFSVRCLKD
jgi:uncharacterized protein (TIGR02145 family)